MFNYRIVTNFLQIALLVPSKYAHIYSDHSLRSSVKRVLYQLIDILVLVAWFSVSMPLRLEFSRAGFCGGFLPISS